MPEKYQPLLDGGITPIISPNDRRRFADLHLHTNRSRDGLVDPEEMVDLALAAGMYAVAITDHDNLTMEGFDYASRRSMPLEVLTGMEVTTHDGHVLALNISTPIRPGMPLEQTIKAIHNQRGFAIIPHPGYRIMSSVPISRIRNIIESPDPGLYLDGIEMFNAAGAGVDWMLRPLAYIGNPEANIRKFVENNKQNPKIGALVANTDSHTRAIGHGISVYSELSVLDAIAHRTTIPMVADSGMIGQTLFSLGTIFSIMRHTAGKR